MLAKSLSRTWPKSSFKKTLKLSDLITLNTPARFDYKFCVPENLLQPMLELLREEDFSIIVFDSQKKHCWYQTKYFDTIDFKHFHQHRRGKLPRTKFRWRKYLESQDSFLEKKEKTNSSKTTKTRFEPIKKKSLVLQLEQNFQAKYLQECLSVGYERATLYSKNTGIKITIDRFLTLDEDSEKKEIMPNFFILEVKVPKVSEQGFSVLKKFLHSHQIRTTSFSKYCIGMCLKYPFLPKNKWKQILKKYIAE